MCRSADIECDLPEYCTGHSEYCPPDVYKLDAEPCNGGKVLLLSFKLKLVPNHGSEPSKLWLETINITTRNHQYHGFEPWETMPQNQINHTLKTLKLV